MNEGVPPDHGSAASAIVKSNPQRKARIQARQAEARRAHREGLASRRAPHPPATDAEA